MIIFQLKNNKTKILYFSWICVMLLAMLMIWPGGKIRYTKEVRGHSEEFQYSLELVTMNTIQQEFVAEYDELQNVVVYFSNIPTENFCGVMHLNLLDAEGNLLAHDYVEAKDMKEGYHSFSVHSKLRKGETYSFYIYSENMEQTAPKLVYRSLSVSGPEENRNFYMNGILFEDCSAAGGYDYKVPLRMSQILVYDLFILWVGLMIKQILILYFTKKVTMIRINNFK